MKNNTIKKKIIICLIIILCLPIIEFSLKNVIFRACGFEELFSYDKTKQYIESDLENLRYGNEIETFLPAYPELDNVENVFLEYRDGRWNSTLIGGRTRSGYSLEITYIPEQYALEKENILSMYEDKLTWRQEDKNGHVYAGMITLSVDITKKGFYLYQFTHCEYANVKGISFNDYGNVIQYIYLIDCQVRDNYDYFSFGKFPAIYIEPVADVTYKE